MKAPWHVSVLIPARDEEELLPRCLNSVRAARSLLAGSTTVDVVVAVDSSNDGSRQIAEQMVYGCGVVICTRAGIVGRARALAAEVALRRYDGPRNRCWLANTDADTCVPASWLKDQISLAVEGLEAIAGTVDVDHFREHGSLVQKRFRNSYVTGPDGSHPHVHGANLGVRADAYLRAGGWRNLPTAEDHDLWNRLAKSGARRASVAGIRVLTSGRRVGRAPHGFAEALSAHNGTPA
jgi:glycosyltransferase involved in cell wall biosynthesis